MNTMDLKSISWVGDMYQRFESLCVEAEENMYKDTVKYVEDQMRTVGASVKKFYSDVIHDLLPQSSSDTVKEENPLLNVVNHADVMIRKFKVINEKKSVNTEAEEEMMNDSVYAANGDNIANFEQCVNKDFQSPCAELVSPNLDICSAKDLDNREDSECKSPHSEVQNESNEPLSQLVDVSAESASVMEVSFNEEDGVGIAKQMTEGNGSDVSSTCADIEITFTNDAQSSEGVDLDLFVSDTGTSNALVASEIKRGDADKQGVLLIKQLNKVNKLEESCVLVDTFTVPGEHKQRSYKKIRDVFTPRRWSKGKKEEEQHAVWYEEQVGKDSVTTMLTRASIKDNSSSCESSESEWELL